MLGLVYMKKGYSVLLIFFLVLFSSAFAQIKRANRYYENFEYSKAIPLYKKALKKKESTEALERIAYSHRRIKDYEKAELYYARLMKQTDVRPINHFFYGQVLKANDKRDEAREQLRLYAEAFPQDKKTETSLKSFSEIKTWISQTQEFEVRTLDNINTSHSEFSPVLYKNKLVFVSDRSQDLINNSTYSWDDQPYLNVFESELKTQPDGNVQISKKAKSFSWLVNTEFHDGPVCFSPDGNTMYLTRVNYLRNKKDPNFINRPQLFISQLNKNKWGKLQSFKYNNEAYSIAHPAISPDGQWLFFASDMPGGFGGMDIYVCKKEGDDWGAPKNLGDEVNTEATEVFPYVRKDGKLYFSSDGHAGFGGLDIYSAIKIEGKYTVVKNMSNPLNSSTDDFGIVFTDEEFTKGYFSSDRKNGKGSDDIYGFNCLNKVIAVSGKILFSRDVNDPVKNTKVMLFREGDEVILSVSNTDSTGYFRFDKLDPEYKYLVKLDESDPVVAAKKKYFLADEEGQIIRVTVINDRGERFIFQNLPANPNTLPDLNSEDVSIAGKLMVGDNPSKPVANAVVNLYNEKGDVIQTTTTTENGSFVFTDLPADKNFLVRLDEADAKLTPNAKIQLTTKDGKVIGSEKVNEKGNFSFTLLAGENNSLKELSVSDSELKIDLKGKLLDEFKNPLSSTTINLVNEKGEVLKSTQTSSMGEFKFFGLNANKNLDFTLNENEQQLKVFKTLYITDANGNIIKEITRYQGAFKFTLLPSDQKKMGIIYAEDPALKPFAKAQKNQAIAGNVLYGGNPDKPLANVNVYLYNENGVQVQSALTDQLGAFVFNEISANENYTLKLKQSEIKLPAGTIVKITNREGKVIATMISQPEADFVYSLLAHDDNSLGALLVDDTQLKFNMKGKLLTDAKLPLANATVNLVSESGAVLKTTKTGADGDFNFYGLPANKDLLFALNENEEVVKPFAKLYLTDAQGNIIKEFSRYQGQFKFTLLASEQNKMGTIEAEDPKVKFNPSVLAGNVVYGDSLKALPETNVYLYNDKNDLVQTSLTSALGAFVFNQIDPKQNYTLKLKQSEIKLPVGTVVKITDRSGKVLATMITESQGDFVYTLLSGENNTLKQMLVEDEGFKFDMKGKLLNDAKAPLANATIKLVNEKGEILNITKTATDGSFKFIGLPANRNLTFALDENEEVVKPFATLYLTDAAGNIIKEFKRYQGAFNFTLLAAEQNKMGTVYEEDTWLKSIGQINGNAVDSVINIENIYYDFAKHTILPQAQLVLDKVVTVMKKNPNIKVELSANTDSRGSAAYNLDLSIRRARAAADYIVSKGISRKRIVSKGFGESRLVNGCLDGVLCPEEEHAKNRRTEFKISRIK
ncbi:MAG: PD40 domain-containing protein [Bacteroidia bacterium]|nr:PD40 domain-containing protein [Bacteroidia bacterium]